jgi:hypothetical protein
MYAEEEEEEVFRWKGVVTFTFEFYTFKERA